MAGRAAQKQRLGDIRFRGGGSPLTQLTGRDVKERTSPYQQLIGQVRQTPQPGRMAAGAWSMPGAAQQQAVAAASPMDQLTQAIRGAQKDPAKIGDLVNVLLRKAGPQAQRHVFPMIETLMRRTGRQAEIETEQKGALGRIAATAEEKRRTAAHAAGLPMTEREKGELGIKERGATTAERRAELYGERTTTYAKSIAGAEKRGQQLNSYRNKLLAVQRTKVRSARQNKQTELDLKQLESLNTRIASLHERLGRLEDVDVIRGLPKDADEDALKKLADLNTKAQGIVKTQITALEKKYATRLKKVRNVLGEAGPVAALEPEVTPEVEAEVPDIFAGPEWQPTERAPGTPAPTMEDLTPEQPAAEGPTELKPLTPNIVAEAKRKFPNDEEAAAAWLAGQGYKLE